jgi:transposase
VLVVVKGRTKEEVHRARERRPRPAMVRAVSMDMAGNFRAAGEEALPGAVGVAGKFPVVRRGTAALRQARQRRATRTAAEDRRRTAGKRARRARERGSDERRAPRAALLGRHPPLRRASLLKEDFRRRSRRATGPGARRSRRALSDVAGLPEFRALPGMFDRWQEEILSDFAPPVTPCFVEGQNPLATAPERRAFGYRNVGNLGLHLRLAGEVVPQRCGEPPVNPPAK